MTQRNRALIATLVAGGMSEAAATDHIETVFGAIIATLLSGKPVNVTGVGDLRPKRERIYVPGSCDRQRYEVCRVSMRRGIVWKGEPYAAEPPEKAKVTVSTGGARP